MVCDAGVADGDVFLAEELSESPLPAPAVVQKERRVIGSFIFSWFVILVLIVLTTYRFVGLNGEIMAGYKWCMGGNGIGYMKSVS